MLKKVIIIAGLVAIAAVISAAESNLPRESEYDYDPPAPGSYSLPVIKMAGDGGVIDSADSSIRLHELTHGRITVLSFIYTRCAAGRACPYATNVLGQIHRISAEDKALTRNMRLVSLSFDPEYRYAGAACLLFQMCPAGEGRLRMALCHSEVPRGFGSNPGRLWPGSGQAT